jgi:aryl-alcohol dehydrogenase-like predicted oxidoreductase
VPRLTSKEDYDATLQYVWSVPGVTVAIIGLRNVEELRPALAAARAWRPFTKVELARVTQRGKQLAAEWGEVRGPAV